MNAKPQNSIPIEEFTDIKEKPATEKYFLEMIGRMDTLFQD